MKTPKSPQRKKVVRAQNKTFEIVRELAAIYRKTKRV